MNEAYDLNNKYNINTLIWLLNFCDNFNNITEENSLCTLKMFEEFAKLTHTLPNLMLCPQGFNSPKGLLSDVNDYFPLMIDKIQQSVHSGCNIVCGKKASIIQTNMTEWHKFYAENIDTLCLDMYYSVEKDGDSLRLVGKTFFVGQSLEHPSPTTPKEIEECLKKMISGIKTREIKLSEELN